MFQGPEFPNVTTTTPSFAYSHDCRDGCLYNIREARLCVLYFMKDLRECVHRMSLFAVTM